MNILLIFFAIPIATIILSAILETFIHCPYKVAGIFFSIFIVVAFALGGTAELVVAALVYTIISFLTAYIVMIIQNRRNGCCNDNCEDNSCNNRNCCRNNNCSNNSCESNCRSNNCCNENNDNNFSLNNNFSAFNPNTFSFNNENFIPNSLAENDNSITNTNNTNSMYRRYR